MGKGYHWNNWIKATPDLYVLFIKKERDCSCRKKIKTTWYLDYKTTEV